MRKSWFCWLSLILGLGAAFVRSQQLHDALNPETNLVTPWHPTSLVLMGLCVAMAALALAVGLRSRATATRALQEPPPEHRPLRLSWLILEVVSLLFLLLSVLFPTHSFVRNVDRYGYIEAWRSFFARPPLSTLLFCVLTLFAVAAVYIVADGLYRQDIKSPKALAFWATVPTFWGCFALVMDFWSHSGEPMRQLYVYGMFAFICATLASHFAAGLLLGKHRRGQALTFALLGLFFALLTFGGVLLYQARFAPEVLLNTLTVSPHAGTQGIAKAALLATPALARFAFIALHLFALSWALTKPGLLPSVQAAADTPPDNADELADIDAELAEELLLADSDEAPQAEEADDENPDADPVDDEITDDDA